MVIDRVMVPMRKTLVSLNPISSVFEGRSRSLLILIY